MVKRNSYYILWGIIFLYHKHDYWLTGTILRQSHKNEQRKKKFMIYQEANQGKLIDDESSCNQMFFVRK